MKTRVRTIVSQKYKNKINWLDADRCRNWQQHSKKGKVKKQFSLNKLMRYFFKKGIRHLNLNKI